ncbi:thiolase family protein [Saccharopolyspora sp. HNM0983]|uniref:Thiolase family protein n=1 Tax=Saccharopolyspora montiporae TaxID=2781240 RepID=A0A929BBQ5_9PSEU|nr:thiolase family protein [Saccharopolyspora sp. HNM0983]MBE9374607.1 thiolase family protein [Saccharopolyspora sp. HNM0983]
MHVPDVAIAGLGMTELGKVYDRSSAQFGIDAIRLAAEDAGIGIPDIDGLLINPGISGGIDLQIQRALGLTDLGFAAQLQAFGSSAGAMVTQAALAIGAGMASTVACVFADAPLRPSGSSGSAYADPAQRIRPGLAGLGAAGGALSPNAGYALAARRHMDRYGTTSEQLGHVAVSTREWAVLNPLARFRDKISVADHQDSRWIVEPLHLLDCCMVSNGGIAVLVTSGERARDLRNPPVHVLGWGQGHPGYREHGGSEFGLVTGAAQSGRTALGMAGLRPADVGIREIYDCYTYTTLVTLEDYGFCAKGEGGQLASSGALGPGGSLPTNTGGGQLSSYYMWGMTPLSEAVLQARGHGGQRQVADNDVVLVSGNGGILDHHSTLLLSPHARS